MTDYLKLLDELESEFKARMAPLRELVLSDRFANLPSDEKSALFAMKLQKAITDQGDADECT